jgi:diguanylate cyclase (GGDEF)-like protein
VFDVDSSQPTPRPGDASGASSVAGTAATPADARALRLGVLLGVGLQLLSMVWDYLVAPWVFTRLLQWRGAGIALLLVAALLSYAMAHRARWLLAATAAGSAVTLTASALILPFGFGYGIGALMSVAMAIALVALDKRTALIAAASVLVATAATLVIRGGNKDTMLAIGFFLVPSLVIAVVFAHVTSLRVHKNQALRGKLDALRDDLARFGHSDELTGVHDHKQMNALARREIALARRKKHALSALKIDVLHLDQINTQHGRAAGDETLRAVASMVQATLRETDLLARVAGDEFAAVLPEADAAGAAIISERLRKGLEKASVLAGDKLLTVSVSVGAATLVDSDQGFEDLLARADVARLGAKNDGHTKKNGA